MIDFLLLVGTGALVGFAVGLTGVGGGSLMTPLLLMFGYPAPIAIGTDLLYAGITKSSGVVFHHRQQSVNWRIVILMAAGSIPASLLLNLVVLNDEFRETEFYDTLLTTTLGVMLLLTATVIFFKGAIQKRITGSSSQKTLLGKIRHKTIMACVVLGVVLGICVTLSSVGAGAIGAAVLFILYPKIKTVNIVGTDIAHAVPLTLVAGLGYLYNGLVDFKLLGALLCGSLPGIYFGSRMGSRLSDKLLRNILVVALLALGIKMVFFQGH